MKNIIAVVAAVMFLIGLGALYAEDDVNMPSENLSKGTISTKEMDKNTNEDTGNKVTKYNKEKKMGKEKKKMATEEAK
ncbi:MAG: hypothetical protein ACLP2X_20920 [Syntrophobacteraceae bacterium]